MKSICFANTNKNIPNPLKHVDFIHSIKKLNLMRMKPKIQISCIKSIKDTGILLTGIALNQQI